MEGDIVFEWRIEVGLGGVVRFVWLFCVGSRYFFVWWFGGCNGEWKIMSVEFKVLNKFFWCDFGVIVVEYVFLMGLMVLVLIGVFSVIGFGIGDKWDGVFDDVGIVMNEVG